MLSPTGRAAAGTRKSTSRMTTSGASARRDEASRRSRRPRRTRATFLSTVGVRHSSDDCRGSPSGSTKRRRTLLSNKAASLWGAKAQLHGRAYSGTRFDASIPAQTLILRLSTELLPTTASRRKVSRHGNSARRCGLRCPSPDALPRGAARRTILTVATGCPSGGGQPGAPRGQGRGRKKWGVPSCPPLAAPFPLTRYHRGRPRPAGPTAGGRRPPVARAPLSVGGAKRTTAAPTRLGPGGDFRPAGGGGGGGMRKPVLGQG